MNPHKAKDGEKLLPGENLLRSRGFEFTCWRTPSGRCHRDISYPLVWMNDRAKKNFCQVIFINDEQWNSEGVTEYLILRGHCPFSTVYYYYY